MLPIHCRAALLADMVALADGVVTTEPEPCDDLAAYVVVIARRGIELAAELCPPHAQLAELDSGYVRVIKKRVRT